MVQIPIITDRVYRVITSSSHFSSSLIRFQELYPDRSTPRNRMPCSTGNNYVGQNPKTIVRHAIRHGICESAAVTRGKQQRLLFVLRTRIMRSGYRISHLAHLVRTHYIISTQEHISAASLRSDDDATLRNISIVHRQATAKFSAT